ncbi:hypothetical protein [Pseudonocardia sp. H11422]|uniref:hypothetical protein n=1 Tax=Pseudonocardia sp. H11422 TaxID=2835866 RepID=UPI002027ACEC|nr:hypothetical protein [Pseudonocardia sp. H11422]
MAATVSRLVGSTTGRQVRRGHAGRLALVAAFGVLVFGTWAAWSSTIDDAYITFRYSEHLASGYGPVWNVGADPVEGFTNFGWMLWHAPFAALGADLPTVAALTSALLALAVLVLLVRHAGSRVGAITSAGSFLVFLPTYFHITAGLETVAFAAVLLRLVVLGLRVLQGGVVRPWEPPLLLLAAGMLRPEGVAAAFPAVAVWLWRNRADRTARMWAAAGAAAGLGYFGWRWSFYGQLLPNTFYVKFGNVSAGYTWLEVTTAALLPLIVLTGALVLRPATAGPGLLLCSTVAVTYVTYAVSGPSMDYLHRFAFHAFPLLCLGAGLAVAHPLRRRTAGVVCAVTVGWVALAGITADDLPTIVNYGTDLQRAHVAIGQGLAAAAVPADERTSAVSDAGAIPYYSGWHTTDYIGLNDEAIAAGADVTQVVAEADPTVLIVTGNGRDPAPDAYGLRTAAATAGYERIADVPMRDGYSQHVFVKSAWAAAVRPGIREAVAAAQAAHDPGRYELTVDRWLDRLGVPH